MMLLISFAASYLSALICVLVPNNFFPAAHSVSHRFADPSVKIMFYGWAPVSAIIAFPAVYFCLRERNLRVAVPIIFGAVVLWAGIFALWDGWLSWWGTYIAFIAALLFCMYSHLKWLQL